MALLPYDKTYVIDETRGIAAATPPASLNIASIIVSETGPVERQTLASQDDLIDLYCTGSAISATDNETIQFNGALLTQVGVDVIRVDSSAMRFGIGSIGSKMYFDTDYNLLEKVTKAKLSKKSEQEAAYYITLTEDDTDKVYYIGDNTGLPGTAIELDSTTDISIKNFFEALFKAGLLISNTDKSCILKPGLTVKGLTDGVLSGNLYNVTENTIPANTVLKVQTEESSSSSNPTLVLSIGKYIFTNSETIEKPSEDSERILFSGVKNQQEFLLRVVREIVTNNTILDPWAQSIVVTVEDAAAISNQPFYKYCEMVDDTAICRVPTLISNTTAQLALYDWAIANTKTCTITSLDGGQPYILYNTQTGPSIVSLSTDYISVSIDEDSYIQLDHETDETNNNFKPISSHVIVDDYVFYCGDEPSENIPTGAIFVKVSNQELSTNDFIKELFNSLTTVFTVGRAAGNKFILDGSHTISASNNIEVSEKEVIDQTRYTDSFAIVCKFTSSQNLFDFTYTANDDEYSTFTVNYSFKNRTGEFVMSFDGLAIDGYGKSLYYDNYNEGDNANPYIHITKLEGNDTFSKFSPDKFGSEVLNNEPTESDFAAAILKYIDEKDKYYDFVTDAGHCSVALAGACKQVADERYAMYCPSIPVTYKTVADIKGYIESINLNDFRCHYVAPAHKNTYNGNFLVSMPGSLSYMFARVNAFNTVAAEFSPLFGSVKGAVTAPNLVKNFTKKEDSQALLDLNINTIIRNSNGTYMQSAFTSMLETSYLQDDQNAYMCNVLSHVCEQYNPTIQAEINDPDLWQKVIDELTTRITQRMITGKNPKLQGFKVICDEKLNTREVIEARQLIYEVWAMYPLAVDYVLAYTHVKRLGSF